MISFIFVVTLNSSFSSSNNTPFHCQEQKMGRDYWYWRRKAKPSKRAQSAQTTTTTLSGCITALFHLFGSHHLHCPLTHQTSTISSSPTSSSSSKPQSFVSQHTTTTTTTLEGAEAPRNSLELEEEDSTSPSLTSTTKQEDILNIPMGIQIKTGGDIRSVGNDTDTPRTNTPTLVARLMGLDLLPPETHSPSSFQSQAKSRLSHHIPPTKPLQSSDMRGGTRSLPETPRTSSARRSDVDHRHHRLSLEINKENMSPSEELIMSRLSSLMKRKEFKHEYEIVSRKVGMNITNAVQNREVLDDSSILKHTTHSSSKFLVSKSKPSTNNRNPQHPKSTPRIQKQTGHKLQAIEEEQDKQHKPIAKSKCKKGSNKKFISRLKKPQQQALEINRNKKEDHFVRSSTRVNIPNKKCRTKTPLSNDLLKNKIPTLVPVKKYPSPPSTKIPQKQVLDADAQRSRHSSQTLSSSTDDDRRNYAASTTTTISTAGDEAEYEYIARILRRTGLNKDTQVSFLSWFSPSHPLDPSIFHYLEHFITCSTNDNKTKCSQLRHRCNRKLLFHLVDELLTGILKPYFNMKPWVMCINVGHGYSSMNGSQLIDRLCSKIRSFPRSDCHVLEDIDALIGRDFPDIKLQRVVAYEEEGEGIVAEIEKDIFEALIHEMTVEFGRRISNF